MVCLYIHVLLSCACISYWISRDPASKVLICNSLRKSMNMLSAYSVVFFFFFFCRNFVSQSYNVMIIELITIQIQCYHFVQIYSSVRISQKLMYAIKCTSSLYIYSSFSHSDDTANTSENSDYFAECTTVIGWSNWEV